MSLESAGAFVEKMKTDEDFKKNVNKCNAHEERRDFVKSEGFDFTTDELKLAVSELSEDDLAGVSGGYCIPLTDPVTGQIIGMLG